MDIFRFRHRRRPRWIALFALTLVSTVITYQSVSNGRNALHQWGPKRNVVVALVDFLPGDRVSENDIRLQPQPETALATDTASSIEQVRQRLVTEKIAAGEPILQRRLAAESLEGTSAKVADGRSTFSLSVTRDTPNVAVGDHVDVFALSSKISSRAVVVASDDQRVMFAVEAKESSLVARALADGSVVLALVP